MKKHHYFIGYILRFDNNFNNILEKYIEKINKIKEINIKHTVDTIHTRFLYLGYLDDNTASLLINNKLKPILESMVNKISKSDLNTNCKINKELKIIGDKKTYNKIAMTYNNELIETKIVPLFKNITDKVYQGSKYTFLPHINLMSIKSIPEYKRDIIENKINYNLEFPNSFNLNSIDILRSNIFETRVGSPSKNDKSILETIFTFQINNNSNNSNNNNKSTSKNLIDKSNKKSIIKDIFNMFKD